MTGGQWANGVGSALAMATSGIFIITWTVVGNWWRTPTGRFMVLKAACICLTGVLTVALTVTGFTTDWDCLRYIQSALWFLVSIAFLHHTRMVWRVNHKREDNNVSTHVR